LQFGLGKPNFLLLGLQCIAIKSRRTDFATALIGKLSRGLNSFFFVEVAGGKLSRGLNSFIRLRGITYVGAEPIILSITGYVGCVALLELSAQCYACCY
jgi:hypothetical protein